MSKFFASFAEDEELWKRLCVANGSVSTFRGELQGDRFCVTSASRLSASILVLIFAHTNRYNTA